MIFVENVINRKTISYFSLFLEYIRVKMYSFHPISIISILQEHLLDMGNNFVDNATFTNDQRKSRVFRVHENNN